MAIDKKKLKALVGKPEKKPMPPEEPEQEQENEDEEQEDPGEGSEQEQDEHAGELSKDAQMQRLQSPEVGYFELGEKAGALACGNCQFVVQEGFCANAPVRAHVSAEEGHCKLFTAKSEPTAPDSWKAMEGVEE